MSISIEKIRRFDRVRYAIIGVFIFGFLCFPIFKLMPKNCEYLVVIYMMMFLGSLFFIVGFFYRCPSCNAVPMARPIPYVDLAPKVCHSCGASLRK